MIDIITGKKILITGGTGFLGRHLTQKLISENIVPTILTRNTETNIWSSRSREKINLIELDLLDAHSVVKFIKSYHPDIIVHFAGATFETEILEKINYEATVNILEAAKTIGVKKFVMLGTADEYGFQKSPQKEAMKAMPNSEYAVSKNRAVNYALSLYKSDALPVVILRPFTIYGIGQPAKMFISQAVKSAVKGLPFEMSEGRQKRDVLFVTDFVNATIKTLTVEGIEGEIFNVGSGESIALRDLAKKIWRIAGANEDLLKIGARQTRENELHNTEADISKIKERLNWQPKVSLDEGLKIFIERVKNNLQ